MENKTIKTKPLPLLRFHVKILLHRPEATWGFLSLSPAHRPFCLHTQSPCKCSWVSGAETIEPFITGVCNCLRNWQPSWLLAQTVWPEPKWPLANHTFLSHWSSTPLQSNIFILPTKVLVQFKFSM